MDYQKLPLRVKFEPNVLLSESPQYAIEMPFTRR